VDQIVEDFLKDCHLRNMTDQTVMNYRSNLRIFLGFLKENKVSAEQVGGQVLKQFLQYLREVRGNSLKRVNNYFSTLSTFYDFLLSENMVSSNPVLPIRRRYLRGYKKERRYGERRAISVEEMSMLVNSILDPEYKAVAVLFAKTGIRRSELIHIDVDDVDFRELSIMLKPCAKRSNRRVFFDDECARVLKIWLQRREEYRFGGEYPALFVSKKGSRLQRSQITRKINHYAELVGLHNPSSKKLEERFSPHYFRHWFTTWLLRNDMKREYVKELRGDSLGDAIDIYNHIDLEDLRIQYLSSIPKLGV